MKKLILILVMLVFFFASINGDVYIKTKTHADAMEVMGKKTPAKDEITEQWIGDNIFASISQKQTVIIDLSKKKLYMIIHESKSYVETTLPLDIKKLLPEQVSQMMGMMKLTIKVTPTSETKMINKWKCTAYNMEMSMMMMKMNSKIWATKDVPFDWEKYQNKFGVETFKSAMASMKIGNDSINELKKIKGFQVKTDMTISIMGANGKVTSDVIEITKKSAPANIYTIPAGYKKTDKLSPAAFSK